MYALYILNHPIISGETHFSSPEMIDEFKRNLAEINSIVIVDNMTPINLYKKLINEAEDVVFVSDDCAILAQGDIKGDRILSLMDVTKISILCKHDNNNYEIFDYHGRFKTDINRLLNCLPDNFSKYKESVHSLLESYISGSYAYGCRFGLRHKLAEELLSYNCDTSDSHNLADYIYKNMMENEAKSIKIYT